MTRHRNSGDSRDARDQGLTLVEMVVSIGVIMVVLISALSVFVTAKKAQQTAEGTDRAIQLANSRLERVRQQDWVDIGFHQATYNAAATAGTTTDEATTATDYAAHVPTGEATVLFTTPETDTGTSIVKPYETIAEHGNKFTMYTTITFGVHPTLPLPTTSATTAANQYSFKRVRVTVNWRSSGSGTAHTVTTESWFAPEAQDAAPPGVPVITE